MNTPPYAPVSPHGAERVADSLWLLRGHPAHMFNVYIMGDVLLDAGSRHARRRILRAVRETPLSGHVLTHAHMDHMGASHAICGQLNLPLMCGAADVEAAESGGRIGLATRPLPMRLAHRLVAGAGHPVSRTLSAGDEVGGFAVLETPGHTPGHLAFWRERDRVLVLGDVLFNVNPATARADLRLPAPMLTRDPALNLASARRLAALRPDVVCFGHGPPLRNPKQFRRFVEAAALDG